MLIAKANFPRRMAWRCALLWTPGKNCWNFATFGEQLMPLQNFSLGFLQCKRDAVVMDAVGFSDNLRVEKVDFVANLLDFCADVVGPAS